LNKIFVLLSVFSLFSLSCFNVSAISYYITNPSPSDEETDISFASNVTTCVDYDEPGQGCSADIYFYENSSGSWVEYENYTNVVLKGTYCGNLSVVCGASYYWLVATLFNCSGSLWWENHTYSFFTSDCPVSHISPSNNSVDNCPCCLAICAKMSNLTGDAVKFAFQSNYSGSWSNLEDERVVPSNTTYCICVPEFVWFNYTYYWRVVYNVGDGAEYSDVFSLVTAENVSDCPCGESDSGYVEVYDGYSMIGFVGVIGILGLLFAGFKRRYK